MTEAQREAHRLASQRYYAENKEKHKDLVKRWQNANPDKMRNYRTKAYWADPERFAEYQRRYQAKNREKVNRAYREKRMRCAQARARGQIGAAMRDILRGNTTTGKYIKLLGCSRDEFLRHLESKFTDGMTWETRGRFGWHIDHVKPLSAFDLTDPKQLAAACHHTNVQPLWWRDNMRKGPKLTLDTPPAV